MGEVDVEPADAKVFYMLSHRYQEDVLSMQCLEVIEEGLSDAHGLELLAEADAKGLVGLKDICMEYLLSKYWKSMTKEKLQSLPHSLVVELLCNGAERYP